jgi:hypothetical protein
MMIDIGSVLKKFDDTVDELDSSVKDYGIRFITADGRVRTMRARKNVRGPQRRLQNPLAEKGRHMFHLKRNGTILVQDLLINQPRTVKVAAICGFADHNSTEFQRVFH